MPAIPVLLRMIWRAIGPILVRKVIVPVLEQAVADPASPLEREHADEAVKRLKVK